MARGELMESWIPILLCCGLDTGSAVGQTCISVVLFVALPSLPCETTPWEETSSISLMNAWHTCENSLAISSGVFSVSRPEN